MLVAQTTENTSSKVKQNSKLTVATQVLLWLSALVVLVLIFQLRPNLRYNYSAERLANLALKPDKVKLGGFYQLQQDAQGNRYLWTAERAVIEFDFPATQAFDLAFEARSAAVAGGPDAPVRVLVAGKEVGILQPMPAKAEFQTFSLRVTPPAALNSNLKVELVSQSFVAPGDKRVLGIMLKSFGLDNSGVASRLERWYWLYWLLPALAVAALALRWLAVGRGWRLAAYGVPVLLALGSGAMLLALAILVRSEILTKVSYPVGTFGTAYLAFVFGLSALKAPFGLAAPGLASYLKGAFGLRPARAEAEKEVAAPRRFFRLVRLLWGQVVFLFVLVLIVSNVPSLWNLLAGPQTLQNAGVSFVERQASGGMGVAAAGLIYADQTLPKDAAVTLLSPVATLDGATLYSKYWLYPRVINYENKIGRSLGEADQYVIVWLNCQEKNCLKAILAKLPSLENYALLRDFSRSTPNNNELFAIYHRQMAGGAVLGD